ncbi:hypothetical protein F5Y18DRAFT_433337 [Xylariaceae sp. FL1019]|nr:hypothetical protein F5Y18DRAFT_433337 [Xylariaceae sp. FL1019]
MNMQETAAGSSERASNAHTENVTTYTWPDTGPLGYIQLPQENLRLCGRCGQLFCGEVCGSCHYDFQEDNTDTIIRPVTTRLAQPGIISGMQHRGNTLTPESRPCGEKAKQESREPGEYLQSGADRLRQIRQAEAAIELQRSLLEREKRKVNESGQDADELAHFVNFDYDPSARGPMFASRRDRT